MQIPPRRSSRRHPAPWMKVRTRSWPRRLRSATAGVRRGADHGWLTVLAPWATVLVAVAALIYTNQANANQLRVQQEANLAQQRLTEQGQITDRFSRAIDQLGQEGTDKLDLRLGGIYGLERIMRDSSADEPAIVEVLCAFVRDHAHRGTEPSPAPGPSGAALPVPTPTTDMGAYLWR
jgi:hypothetical protein